MTAKPPNIIIILTDDQGYADLGCFGGRHVQTPNLDRLATEGTRFTDFYSMPICGPARAALMTGCFPLRLAERHNYKHNMPVLHRCETTLATYLQAAGYATGMFGKWDLAGHCQTPDKGLQLDLLPIHHGFDEYFGTPASNDNWANTTLIDGDRIIEQPISLERGTTERFTDKAIDFIRRRANQPFFMTLATNMPHVSLHTSPAFAGSTGKGLYADTIYEIDHHVGRLVDELHRQNLEQNTILIYFSDNGPWLSKGTHGGCAHPLRSGKLSTWEGGPRVPCLMWGPGLIPAKRVCSEMVRSIDLCPSLLSLAHARSSSDTPMDGEDISSLLTGHCTSLAETRCYPYYFRTHLQGIRQGPWKLILKRPVQLPWLKGCSPNPHIAPDDDIGIPYPRLHHLPTDIGEHHDIAGDHVDLVDHLLAQADLIRQDVGDYNLIGAGARFFDPGPRRPPHAVGGVWADSSRPS